MKYFVIIFIIIFAITSYLISDVDAKCIMGYPCRSPVSPPISAEMAFRSDTIVSGVPIQKYYGEDALTGYDKSDPSNTCGWDYNMHIQTKDCGFSKQQHPQSTVSL